MSVRARPRPSAGFTYVWALLMVAVIGAGAAAAADVWTTHAEREREAELLFIGEQYRQAIGAYFESTPGAARQYPRRLEDLLRDPRYPVVRRYLRRLYADPMTRSSAWGIVAAPDGGIAGVHTTARTSTLRKSGFAPVHAAFENAATHADWQFIYAPGAAGTSTASPRDALAPATTEPATKQPSTLVTPSDGAPAAPKVP